MVRVRRCAYVVLVAAMVATVAGCRNDPSYQGSTGPRVALVGDDVLAASADTLHGTLDATMRVRILAIEQLNSAGLRYFADSFTGATPDVIVLAAGTQDARSGIDPAETLANLEAMLAM